ncbi:MAG: NAD-binding protein [Burkholderiales bacterium]|nr:MAG: NAD-binding protein [Burkholderiales bacterium]
MRVVFIGAGTLTVMTAGQLLEQGREVVIIEKDKTRIDELAADLGAGFIHGDGSKPDVLREADPSETVVLFCLTGNDQYNIIASLVGRSMGCRRVVTRIEDPSYEHICTELGLVNVIVPDRTIAGHLAGMCAAPEPTGD